MKTFISIVSLLTLMTFSAFGQQANVKRMLGNTKTRNEIFSSIMNNKELMSDFMQAVHGNQQAMMMIRNDNQIMGPVNSMGNGNNYQVPNYNEMMSIWHHDPALMQSMMNNMINVAGTDSTLTRDMINQMESHYAIMQMMLQNMHRHGMMGNWNGMNMMNNTVK